jgi:hypothetical protein
MTPPASDFASAIQNFITATERKTSAYMNIYRLEIEHLTRPVSAEEWAKAHAVYSLTAGMAAEAERQMDRARMYFGLPDRDAAEAGLKALEGE